MLKYKIENYYYQLRVRENREDWEDNPLEFDRCGTVKNSSDPSLEIPILVDKISNPMPPYPNFRSKKRRGLSNGKNQNKTSWIIECDIEDFTKLMMDDEECIVALYHEVGHFQYSDEQGRNFGEKDRAELLRQGKAPKEEILADSVAAARLGKEMVIRALGRIRARILMNPKYAEDEKAQLLIKELGLRIKVLEK